MHALLLSDRVDAPITVTVRPVTAGQAHAVTAPVMSTHTARVVLKVMGVLHVPATTMDPAVHPAAIVEELELVALELVVVVLEVLEVVALELVLDITPDVVLLAEPVELTDAVELPADEMPEEPALPDELLEEALVPRPVVLAVTETATRHSPPWQASPGSHAPASPQTHWPVPGTQLYCVPLCPQATATNARAATRKRCAWYEVRAVVAFGDKTVLPQSNENDLQGYHAEPACVFPFHLAVRSGMLVVALKPTAHAKLSAKERRERAKRAPQLAASTLARLAAQHPDAHCELNHRSPFELIVSVVLSAQTTDVGVNKATPKLFARFPDAKALAAVEPLEVEPYVASLGFFRQKSKAIVGLARALVERHGGQVPRSLEELVKLPGVGRKTANVVLGVLWNKPEGVVVDTHVARLSQRLGWSKNTDPEKIERDLASILPRSEWDHAGHVLIFHGRYCCDARKPDCDACHVNDVCPSAFAGAKVGRKPR